jgi:hypothetical protein
MDAPLIALLCGCGSVVPCISSMSTTRGTDFVSLSPVHKSGDGKSAYPEKGSVDPA